MEEILAVAVFGLGAALGMRAVGAVTGGLRPLMRSMLVGGIIATDAARSTVSRAGQVVSSATAGATRGLEEIRTEAEAELSSRGKTQSRRTSRPRQINVIKEE